MTMEPRVSIGWSFRFLISLSSPMRLWKNFRLMSSAMDDWNAVRWLSTLFSGLSSSLIRSSISSSITETSRESGKRLLCFCPLNATRSLRLRKASCSVHNRCIQALIKTLMTT